MFALNLCSIKLASLLLKMIPDISIKIYGVGTPKNSQCVGSLEHPEN